MRNEKQPNLSAEYGSGIGKVEFRTAQFSTDALREIARLQIASTDSPFIMFSHTGGRTTTMTAEELNKAKTLKKKELRTFTTELGRRMAIAEKVSITREAQKAPYHPSSEFKSFIQGISSLDEL